MENLFDLILDGSRNPMKQSKVGETNLKQSRNEPKLSLKLTPRSKRDRTRV